MQKQQKYPVTIIRRSCLTGKAVWIYRGPSKEAARKAYQRACKKEIERVRNWPQTVRRRSETIGKLLSDCLSKLPVNAKLTPQQEEAAKKLRALQKADTPYYLEFYNHILEEARRRNASSSRWVENRKNAFGI